MDDLKHKLRVEVFKYLALYYSFVKEEGDIWTNDIIVDDKAYAVNIFEEEEFYTVMAYPVIPYGNYTKEDMDNSIRLMQIKELQ